MDRIAAKIIEKISYFPFSTDYIDWLSNGSFSFSILSEKNEKLFYRRVIEFRVCNFPVLRGWTCISKKQIKEDVFNDFLDQQKPIGRYIALHPNSCLSKEVLSKTKQNFTYKILSKICYLGSACGDCKEVFNLNNIILCLDHHGEFSTKQ